MQTVKIWQACALSLNLDPDSIKISADIMGLHPHFKMQSFPNEETWNEFNKRLRLRGEGVNAAIALSDFVSWTSSLSTPFEMPQEFVALAKKPETRAATPVPAPTSDADNDGEKAPRDMDVQIAGLFDLVGTAQLEKMFPATGGNWSKWAAKAKANGLSCAREDRGKFNPYRAALWWLDKQNPAGWDWARCCRVLANNLPSRSIDSRHLLRGELE